MSARVGIVVIGRNEGDRLTACLAAVTGKSMPVIYADSASSDDSVSRAEEIGTTVVAIDASRPMNAARGRREGAERLFADHHSVEFIQFLDGDCIVQPGWIDAATAFLDNRPDVAAVCGRRFEASPKASIYNRICDAEWDTPVGEMAAVGGDALIRVEAYRAVGGFDPTIVAGEEPELCDRLRTAGWRIWRIDAPMTEHDMAMTRLSQWMSRSYRGGFGFAQVWRTTGGRLFAKQLLSAFAWMIAMPLVVMAVAVFGGAAWLLFIPLAYAMQIVRLAGRRGIARRAAWQEAALTMAGKGSEAMGALAYFLQAGFARASAPGDVENVASGFTFGFREATLLCLMASVIACFVAWHALTS